MTTPSQPAATQWEIRFVGLAPPLTPKFVSVLWQMKALIADWYGDDARLTKLMQGHVPIGYRVTVRNSGDFAFFRMWLPDRLRERGIAPDAVRIEIHAAPTL